MCRTYHFSFVIFLITAFISIQNLGEQSTNTSFAPDCNRANPSAENVNAGIITSSPFFKLRVLNKRERAAVPLAQLIAYLLLYSLQIFFKFFTKAPDY